MSEKPRANMRWMAFLRGFRDSLEGNQIGWIVFVGVFGIPFKEPKSGHSQVLTLNQQVFFLVFSLFLFFW